MIDWFAPWPGGVLAIHRIGEAQKIPHLKCSCSNLRSAPVWPHHQDRPSINSNARCRFPSRFRSLKLKWRPFLDHLPSRQEVRNPVPSKGRNRRYPLRVLPISLLLRSGAGQRSRRKRPRLSSQTRRCPAANLTGMGCGRASPCQCGFERGSKTRPMRSHSFEIGSRDVF